MHIAAIYVYVHTYMYTYSCYMYALQLYKLCAERAGRGEEAVLRSLEQLQQASQPLYTNLFIPFSNQPNGMLLLAGWSGLNLMKR